MKLYLAPLEGITGYIYRNALAAVFEQRDKFFAPFIGTSQNKKFSNKEVRDINPQNNKINVLIPQLMTKHILLTKKGYSVTIFDSKDKTGGVI